MTVQAGAVRRLLRPDQEKEREALETVEATGREALTEMRRLVGLLREQGAMPEFSPQPGLGTMDALLDGVHPQGSPWSSRSTASRELPPGVDLTAYRVVQEALTNALKYGGTAHAWVALRWREDELELEVANDGRGDGDGTGGGHGLAGMQERVLLYGGELESGPRAGAAGSSSGLGFHWESTREHPGCSLPTTRRSYGLAFAWFSRRSRISRSSAKLPTAPRRCPQPSRPSPTSSSWTSACRTSTASRRRGGCSQVVRTARGF